MEVCFYITSLELDVDKFARSVRQHWGVENGLHLSLDVIFEEDKYRYQDKVGAANLSLLRKVALSILAKDTTLKCGKPAKQMRAATSFAFRDGQSPDYSTVTDLAKFRGWSISVPRSLAI